MENKVFNWIKKQTSKIEKKAKRNLAFNYLIFFLTSAINIAVIGLSIWVLVILLTFFQKNSTSNLVFQIIMACLAAGCNLLIFVFTVFNLLYRSKMKFDVYREAIFAIQNEYMKFSLKHEKYLKSKNPKEDLEKEVAKIFNFANSKEKNKVKLTKVITKVIKKGNNV